MSYDTLPRWPSNSESTFCNTAGAPQHLSSCKSFSKWQHSAACLCLEVCDVKTGFLKTFSEMETTQRHVHDTVTVVRATTASHTHSRSNCWSSCGIKSTASTPQSVQCMFGFSVHTLACTCVCVSLFHESKGRVIRWRRGCGSPAVRRRRRTGGGEL